jgi:hypothetical protein
MSVYPPYAAALLLLVVAGCTKTETPAGQVAASHANTAPAPSASPSPSAAPANIPTNTPANPAASPSASANTGATAKSSPRRSVGGLFFGRQYRVAQVVEIEQLHNALSAYKEAKVQYPPSLAEAVVTDRKIHFMRHLQVAFNNSNYGVTAAHFDNIRNQLRIPNGLGAGSQPYTYRAADGSVLPLDLNTLDQAETLVFWLGGFPTPVKPDGTPLIAQKHYGFNTDRDSPFKRDAAAMEGDDPLKLRTVGYYDFKQSRLVDRDGDGWLEYIPDSADKFPDSAPFVYFDADTYNASTTAPGVKPFDIKNLVGYPRAGDPQAKELAARWGVALPVAEQYNPDGTLPTRWQRDKSFQILAPGDDDMYSAPVTGDLAAAMRLTVFPSGDTYTKAGNYTAASKSTYSKEELDNLSSLTSKTFGEARDAK